MGEQFSPEQFEKLSGLPLGFYGAKISKEGELPVDFIDYFKVNTGRWDGQHLEVALALLRMIDTDVARHLIADYLNHPLKHIRLTVLGMVDQMNPIDDYILARIHEKLRSTADDEFGVSTLKRIQGRAVQKSAS
jgi:hypothetical protein